MSADSGSVLAVSSTALLGQQPPLWMPLMEIGLAVRMDMLDEATAKRNHGGQTLRRLCERGGLSPCEAAAIAKRREWRSMELAEALAVLIALQPNANSSPDSAE